MLEQKRVKRGCRREKGEEVYEGEGSATDENQIFHKERYPGILTVKLLNGFSSRTIKKGGGETFPLDLELEICKRGKFSLNNNTKISF